MNYKVHVGDERFHNASAHNICLAISVLIARISSCKYCDEYVCVHICLSARISPEPQV